MTDERRERYAAEIYNAADGGKGRPWRALYESDREFHRRIADAVMAVADAEQQAMLPTTRRALEAWKKENDRLRVELERMRARAEKAERAVNLLADAHRRAEQAEAAIARAAERVAAWEQRLPEAVQLAPIIETVRRDLGIEEARGKPAEAPLCAECGHTEAQHQDADEPVSVGLCTACDEAGSDEAHHDYEPEEQQ